MPPKKRASLGMPKKRKDLKNGPTAQAKMKQTNLLDSFLPGRIGPDNRTKTNDAGHAAHQNEQPAPARKRGRPPKVAAAEVDKENANVTVESAGNKGRKAAQKKAPKANASANGNEALGTGDWNANFVQSTKKVPVGKKQSPSTSPELNESSKAAQTNKAMTQAQQTLDDLSDVSSIAEEPVVAKKKKATAAKNKDPLAKDKTAKGTTVKRSQKASQRNPKKRIPKEKATGSPDAPSGKRAGKKPAIKRPRDRSKDTSSDDQSTEEEPAPPLKKKTAAKNKRIRSRVPDENANEIQENSASSGQEESRSSSRTSPAQTTGELSTIDKTSRRSSKTPLQNRWSASASARTPELSETERIVKNLEEEKEMLEHKIFQVKQQIQALRLRQEIEESDRINQQNRKLLDSEEDVKEAADIIRRTKMIKGYTGLKLLKVIRERDPSDPSLRHCYLRGYALDTEFIMTFKNPINVVSKKGTVEDLEMYFPSGYPPGLEDVLEPWKVQGNLEQCLVILREYRKKMKYRDEILEDLNYFYKDIIRVRTDPETGQMTLAVSNSADAFLEINWLLPKKPPRIPGQLNFFFRLKLTEKARKLFTEQQLDPGVIVKEMQKDPKKVLRTLAELVTELV